jgi:dTDP-glucose 4,6-dehydratase
MRILVTGAAGFIGSNYVQHLLDTKDDVRVVSIDALTYAGNRTNLDAVSNDDRHKFVEADIRNADRMSTLVTDADHIVNFAAESHVDRSIDGTKPFVSTNLEGTRVLLDAALDTDIKSFLQVSTDEVYGEIYEGAFSEGDPLQPRNPYAATKAGADHLVRSYYTTYGLPVSITRSSNNYGPHQHPEKLIPKLISRARAGEPLPIYGDGSHVREWTYVTDNCRAIEKVRVDGATGEIYNVGSGVERTNLSVAESVVELTDASEELITFVKDRPGHDARYALDTEKIEALGWEPTVSFEEGLERTVAYYTDT